MVTGGITLSNIQQYVLKGGVAIGIGSNLVDPGKLKTELDYHALSELANRYDETLQREDV